MKALKKITNILAVVSTVVIFSAEAFAATLHVLLTADTDDKSIGKSVEIDIKNWESMARTISKHTGMRMKLKVLKGKQLTKSKVSGAVKSVRPGKDDAVIFIYSGHGYRTQSKKDKWPALFLKNNKGLNFQWVINTLEKKNPRFILAISDSCNNVISESWAPSFRMKSFARAVPAAYKKLFLTSRGRIYASGSRPGQYSMGDNYRGGLFTHQFLGSIKDAAKTQKPSWKAIMKKGAKPIPVKGQAGGGKTQDPQYELIGFKGNQQTTIIATTTGGGGNTTGGGGGGGGDVTVTDPVDITDDPVTTTGGGGDETITDDPIDITGGGGDDPITTGGGDDENLTGGDEFGGLGEDDPCMEILDVSLALGDAIEKIDKNGKLRPGSKVYKKFSETLDDLLAVGQEEGDQQLIQIITDMKNNLRRKKWNKVIDGLLPIFEQLGPMIDQECKQFK